MIDDYSRELQEILAGGPPDSRTAGASTAEQGEVVGLSREGRAIRAFRLGDGPLRVSLVGGCHADEPVGPRLLVHLIRYLHRPGSARLRRAATWFVIPHINPDGAARNAAWQKPGAECYDLVAYLRHRTRELPGDDIEFGFPHNADDSKARPENRAAAEFWRSAAPFDLHVSLHGMAMAGGPYFLVERAWWPRCGEMARTLANEVAGAGYVLHDVDREGEKGFHRLQRGFCSRPDSRAMASHFMNLNQPAVAARFRPSSMETVRSFGGDPLTLVTEMPLFIAPRTGTDLAACAETLRRWRERLAAWEARLRVAAPDDLRAEADVRHEAAAAGLAAMPVHDQMRFQWAFIRAGISTVARGGSPGE